MKVNGNGQGKVLTQQELRQLFTEGLITPRDRALFAICLFAGCRVSEAYQPSKPGFLFPGGRPGRPMTRFMADKILKKACERIGVVGVSTHSFRRTALTQMSSAGIPLRHIQEISGHNDLGTLQRYLEVSPNQRKKAVSVIGW
jgi:integrase/recombinase XerD